MLVICIVCIHHSFIFFCDTTMLVAFKLKTMRSKFSQKNLIFPTLVPAFSLPQGLFVSVKKYICTTIMLEFIVVIAGFFPLFYTCHYEKSSAFTIQTFLPSPSTVKLRII